MHNNYSKICDHSRLKRISADFVRCLDCGQSMISQKNVTTNKTSRDFVSENKNFTKNFDRNFNNVLEEVDNQSDRPLYEYYTDHVQANRIVLNRQNKLRCDPPKYEVWINGNTCHLTNQQVQQILNDTGSFRVDKYKLNSATSYASSRP